MGVSMATKAQLLRLMRQFCSECMGGPRMYKNVWPIPNPSDIEACASPKCEFYKYRHGKDPNPNPKKQAQGRKNLGLE
jgi:hypothetical protein